MRTREQRRVLARLRLVRMEMKREGKHVLQSRKAFTDAASTDIAATFRLYDWAPPSQLKRKQRRAA